MGRAKVRVDFSPLRNLQKAVQRLADQDLDKFLLQISNEIAARVLSSVIKLTPTGDYSNLVGDYGKGLKGGTLKRNWRSVVFKEGDAYTILIYNPIVYAVYVEYGHRQEKGRFVPALGKKLVAGWVEGRFMLKKAVMNLESNADRLIGRRLQEYIERALNTG